MKRKVLSLVTAAAITASYAVTLPFSTATAASLLPAFPGAEGAGMYATGGRGGNIVHVTNLNDSGTGSFRDAVGGSNRIVVFDVGGTINLKSDVVVKGNVTILGQTAPGGAGITLKNGKIGMGGDNIIVRFISSRPGEKGSGDYDAWGGSAGSNSIIDHCSIGWANDEQFGLYSKNMNQTVQYCLIGPSDCVSYHSKGAHGFGAMFGKGQNTWHHNMLAHSLSRNFRGKVEKTNSMDFVNNVIYNWGYQTAYGTLGHINYVNNYLKAGPSTAGGHRFLNNSSGSNKELYSFYIQGNTIRNKDGSVYSNSIEQDNWAGVSGFDAATYRASSPFKVSDINGNDASYVSKAESAEDAFMHVINYAGAGISAEKRPRIDQQVMNEALTGTGSLTGGRDFSTVTDSDVKSAISKYGIQQVNYDEYYPAAITKKEITDSDGDGMPDEWETARGLNPKDASDAKGDYLGQGYMNIEYYANDLTINAFPAGVVTESATTVDLGPEYEALKAEINALDINPKSIKTASDLTLPQTGSKNNLPISWSSSSSAIKISNNKISSVTRSTEDQIVTLTATISNGDYTMNKSFAITVISSSSFWKAKESDGGKKAGTELFDGLTTLFDATYKASAETINNESFAGYISSGDNGTFADGKVTGTAFKYVAPESGYLTAYVRALGSATSAKTLYIVEEGAASQNDCVASIAGNGNNTSLTAHVEAGKTYYIYVAGSKGQFAGIEVSPTAKPVWWKASKSVTAGEELMKNLTPMEDMTYKESSKEIDSEPFTGAVTGTTNPGGNGATGASLRYIPETDGVFTFYCKVGSGKVMKINDADGNVLAEYKNEDEASEFMSLSANLKKGVTYYAYVAGSKADIYGASFTEVYSGDTDNPTQPPTAPPTATATPGPTATPTPTVKPTAQPDWWKASKNVTTGEELMKNLSPMEDMTYKESAKEINGESFTGAVTGTTNPGENGATGASLKYIPETYGIFTFYCKVGNGKTIKINDADGNVAAEYTNETGASEFKSLSANLKKGVTYYAYVDGSRAEIFGASFTAIDTPEPTATPTAPPTETEKPDDKPIIITGSLSDEKVTVEAKQKDDGDTVYVAQYDTNGVLIGVTVENPGKFDVKIKDGAKSLRVYVWNKQTPQYNAEGIDD
ncbi:MAG: hypothetical protein J1G06_08450 [Oscillospiraceae bacterium]|nr:hypothetical protein [Oscillospiraceae bacterium]